MRTRGIQAVLAALALAVAAPTRAQAPFPVPVPASVVIVPLLLLALPMGLSLKKSDERKLRELEAQGRYDRIVEWADRELAKKPGDPHWLALRGRALQRGGRCTEALPSLRAAFDRAPADPPKAAYAAGWALALCELVSWELDAARVTLDRLATIDAARWEPVYQRGVLDALQGRTEAVADAVALLASRQPPMADALRAYAAALAGTPVPPADAQVPAEAAPKRLAVGERGLALPAAEWRTGPALPARSINGGPTTALVRTNQARLQSATAYAATPDRRLEIAWAVEANATQAYGIVYWDAPDPCTLARGALAAERFGTGYDRPECLLVRRLSAAEAAGDPALGPVLAAAAASGVAPPADGYAVHYARFGMDWAVSVDAFVPLPRLAGDLAAVGWGMQLAARLRPLAQPEGGRVVEPPPLGPAR